jgi:hypothetical protein
MTTTTEIDARIEIADLRAENARLQTLCDRLAHENGQQAQELLRLRAGMVSVPKLGTLSAATRWVTP